jgi:hypothetical protein
MVVMRVRRAVGRRVERERRARRVYFCLRASCLSVNILFLI